MNYLRDIKTILAHARQKAYVEIVRTLSAQLSWSHFKRVLSVTNEKARMFYLQNVATKNLIITKTTF